MLGAVQATSMASFVSRSVIINAQAAVAARGLSVWHLAGSSIQPFRAELAVLGGALELQDAGVASAQRECPAESSFLRGFVFSADQTGAAQA